MTLSVGDISALTVIAKVSDLDEPSRIELMSEMSPNGKRVAKALTTSRGVKPDARRAADLLKSFVAGKTPEAPTFDRAYVV
jgi:hypothetical protein